ncbi:Msb2 protein [Martiniozyma asiatica (nom. inval.)]|nr:Msb2 protein [Martiniozyma asiatica]
MFINFTHFLLLGLVRVTIATDLNKDYSSDNDYANNLNVTILNHQVLPQVMKHQVLPQVMKHQVLPQVLKHQALHQVLKHQALHQVLKHQVLHQVLKHQALHQVLKHQALHQVLKHQALHQVTLVASSISSDTPSVSSVQYTTKYTAVASFSNSATFSTFFVSATPSAAESMTTLNSDLSELPSSSVTTNLLSTGTKSLIINQSVATPSASIGTTTIPSDGSIVLSIGSSTTGAIPSIETTAAISSIDTTLSILPATTSVDTSITPSSSTGLASDSTSDVDYSFTSTEVSTSASISTSSSATLSTTLSSTSEIESILYNSPTTLVNSNTEYSSSTTFLSIESITSDTTQSSTIGYPTEPSVVSISTAASELVSSPISATSKIQVTPVTTVSPAASKTELSSPFLTTGKLTQISESAATDKSSVKTEPALATVKSTTIPAVSDTLDATIAPSVQPTRQVTPTTTVLPATTDLFDTTAWLPTAIIAESLQSTSLKTGTVTGTTTTTLNIPKVIMPASTSKSVGAAKSTATADLELITIGFNKGLNYEFVLNNSLSSAQIFEFLPGVVSFPFEDIDASDIQVEKLVPFSSSDVSYLITVAELYFNKDYIPILQSYIYNSSSVLYQNSDSTENALSGLIDPRVPLKGLITSISTDDSSAAASNLLSAIEEQSSRQENNPVDSDTNSSYLGSVSNDKNQVEALSQSLGSLDGTSMSATILNRNKTRNKKGLIGMIVGIISGVGIYIGAIVYFYISRRRKIEREFAYAQDDINSVDSGSVFEYSFSEKPFEKDGEIRLSDGSLSREASFLKKFNLNKSSSDDLEQAKYIPQISAPINVKSTLGW